MTEPTQQYLPEIEVHEESFSVDGHLIDIPSFRDYADRLMGEYEGRASHSPMQSYKDLRHLHRRFRNAEKPLEDKNLMLYAHGVLHDLRLYCNDRWALPGYVEFKFFLAYEYAVRDKQGTWPPNNYLQRKFRRLKKAHANECETGS